MAIIDTIKARTEVCVDDTELQALVDEATAELEARLGPSASDGPISFSERPRGPLVDLPRPAVVGGDLVVTERRGDTSTVLSADDYDLRNGGRTLRRRSDGTNPYERWAPDVDLTYTPVDDDAQREEVIVRLVQLSLEYDPVAQRSVGDTSQSNLVFTLERERLIGQLAPRRGLLVR